MVHAVTPSLGWQKAFTHMVSGSVWFSQVFGGVGKNPKIGKNRKNLFWSGDLAIPVFVHRPPWESVLWARFVSGPSDWSFTQKVFSSPFFVWAL